MHGAHIECIEPKLELKWFWASESKFPRSTNCNKSRWTFNRCRKCTRDEHCVRHARIDCRFIGFLSIEWRATNVNTPKSERKQSEKPNKTKPLDEFNNEPNANNYTRHIYEFEMN